MKRIWVATVAKRVEEAGKGREGKGVSWKKEGRTVDMEGWEDRGLRVYSPQRSEVKAKSVLLRKWVQDGCLLFQHGHHSAFSSLIYVHIYTQCFVLHTV